MDLKKQGLKQSRSAKSKNTQEPSFDGTGLMSQSTEILNNSQESSSEQMELFPTLFAEGTLVSRFQLPDSEEARRMTGTSGLKCIDLLPKSDPLGAFSRMLLDTSNWVSTRCYLTWKAKATPQGRIIFQLAPSMPDTKDKEFGLWRTPDTGQGGGSIRGSVERNGKWEHEKGKRSQSAAQVARPSEASETMAYSNSDRSGRAGTQFWETEPSVGRVVNGVPHQSHRLKSLGNAVVPQIPEIIGRTIMRYEREFL